MNYETSFIICKYNINDIADYNTILGFCAAATNSDIFSPDNGPDNNLSKENIEWDIVKEFAEYDPALEWGSNN